LIDIDFSYNQLSNKYFMDLIENLPNFQIENLNLSNCLISENKKNFNLDFITTFTKFIGFNLRSLALRGFYLRDEQTTILIE
jgi:hypothetical protein